MFYKLVLPYFARSHNVHDLFPPIKSVDFFRNVFNINFEQLRKFSCLLPTVKTSYPLGRGGYTILSLRTRSWCWLTTIQTHQINLRADA